eukprot:9231304-Pyramimonas_sp.AAC.1
MMVAAAEGLFQRSCNDLFDDPGVDTIQHIKYWTGVLSELLPFFGSRGPPSEADGGGPCQAFYFIP